MIEARPYQREAVAAVWRYMNRGYGNPVVVAPTGAGKSVIIALLMHEAVTQWPGTRVVCLADVKELVEQNTAAYVAVNEKHIPVEHSLLDIEHSPQSGGYGIYSASVGLRETRSPVTFAQIQSCHGRAELFGRVDFVVVDECHMINPKALGMYREFVDGLRIVNPLLKVVGFTATPYRLGHGHIFKGEESLFSGIAYDIPIATLIGEGFLVPPVARAGACHADTSIIERASTGEFKEASATVEFSRITAAAVADMISRIPDRKSILIFACSIEHAGQIVRELRAHGERAVECVTGETPKDERARIIRSIRDGSTRWLVNVGVLTKGFDAKNIDVVVLLRATESAALYVQMVGRGLRPWPGKAECVVLDYGENVVRHGPIDAVKPRQKGERRDNMEMRAKECVKCGVYIAIACRVCPHCGSGQPVAEAAPSHGVTPANAALLSGSETAPQLREEWYDVQDMMVRAHNRGTPGIKPSLRVEYQIGVANWVSEFVCPEHSGFPRQKAEQWMNTRGYNLLAVEEAVGKNWPKPKRVKVRRGGKWPEVVDYEFGSDFLMG